jgi:hypothetical protein
MIWIPRNTLYTKGGIYLMSIPRFHGSIIWNDTSMELPEELKAHQN